MNARNHDCELMAEAVGAVPPLLWHGQRGFSLPVHDGDGPGCVGNSGISILFCPWDGEALMEDVARQEGSVGGECELMRYYLGIEDLVIVRDDSTGAFVIPEFNGPEDRNCLGFTGIRLTWCPWCGLPLGQQNTPPRQLADLRLPLSDGVRSPRR